MLTPSVWRKSTSQTHNQQASLLSLELQGNQKSGDDSGFWITYDVVLKNLRQGCHSDEGLSISLMLLSDRPAPQCFTPRPRADGSGDWKMGYSTALWWGGHCHWTCQHNPPEQPRALGQCSLSASLLAPACLTAGESGKQKDAAKPYRLSSVGDPNSGSQSHPPLCVCLVSQACPTHCDPFDQSPPGSSVPEIFQARILERVTISFSKGSS